MYTIADDNQKSAHADYIELSLQLQYNCRGRKAGLGGAASGSSGAGPSDLTQACAAEDQTTNLT